MRRVGVCARRASVRVWRVGVCEQRVGAYHWIRLRGWSRLHTDDVEDGGLIPSVIHFPVHLAPGAPHAETGGGDVSADRPLPKSEMCIFKSAPQALEFTPLAAHLDPISVSNRRPESQGSRRRTKQRNPQGRRQAEAQNVTRREAGVLPKPGRNRARQAGAAPEAVAACRSTQTSGWSTFPAATRQGRPTLHVLVSSRQSHKLVCQSVHASAAITG